MATFGSLHPKTLMSIPYELKGEMKVGKDVTSARL